MSDEIEEAARILFYRVRESMGIAQPWSSLTPFEREGFRNDVEAILSVVESQRHAA